MVYQTEPSLPAVFPPEMYSKAPVRGEDLRFLLERLRRGQHCALLSVSNMGKSTLLNSLVTDEGRVLCQSARAEHPPLTVFVDCLEVSDNGHAFYELLMRRLLDEVELLDETLADSLREYHEVLLGTENDVAISSAFSSGIRRLMRGVQRRVIVILDEFDDCFRALPPWPFRHLRATCNSHDDLLLVVATTHALADLRDDDESYEFRELFHLATHTLHPLGKDDMTRLIRYLDQRHGLPTSSPLHGLLMTLSGGHPGLLERLYEVFFMEKIELDAASAPMPSDALMEQLCALPSIQKECARFWQELEMAEQRVLLSILRSESLTEQDDFALRALQRKHILLPDVDPFSPLFAHYVQSRPRKQTGSEPPADANSTDADSVLADESFERTGIFVDMESGRIWFDGDEITWVFGSEHQRHLMILLYQKGGSVCSYDEIANQIWGVGEGVTPGAIRELVNRTRKKLPDVDMIINVPGQGYRLAV